MDGAHTLQLNAAGRTGYQTKAVREQPSRAAKRQKGQAIAQKADCGRGLQRVTDAAMDTGTDHITTTDALAAWISHLPPEPEEVAVAQLPWLLARKINLTMECIASTSFVRVMKVDLYSISLLCSSALHMQGVESPLDLKVVCNGFKSTKYFVAGISRQGGAGDESL